MEVLHKLAVRVGGVAAFIVALLLASGCFSGNDRRVCQAGTQGCACANLQCEAGLECLASTCRPIEAGDTSTDTQIPGPTTEAPDDDAQDSTSSATTDSTDDTTTSAVATESDASTTSDEPSLCGNGVLDPGEECDWAEGCTDCVLDHYACNPLNNVPCETGYKCSYVESTTNFRCEIFARDPPGAQGEGNCVVNATILDEWCDIGLACATFQQTNACDGGGCCVEYCDRLDGGFECATEGDSCLGAMPNDAAPGLTRLGWCVRPL